MNINKHGKRILFLLAALMVLLAGLAFFIQDFGKAQSPPARDGSLDLSNWDFRKDGLVKLNGEWDFYPGVLVKPASLDALSGKQTIQVPGRWSETANGGVMGDQGAGTYRLRIGVNEHTSTFGLKTKNIRSAARIFVNGIEVGNSGSPALSASEGHVTNVVPLVAFFNDEDNQLDLVIQVANPDYYNGGIIQPILLGSQNEINTYTFRVNTLEILGIASLLLSGIYYFGIFLNRRKDRFILYISLFCLTYAGITSMDNEKIFNRLFDSLPFMWILKVKGSIICLSIIVTALLLKEMGKVFMPAAALRGIAVTMGLVAVTLVFTPTPMIAALEQLTGPLYLLAYAAMAFLVLRALRLKQYGRMNRRQTMLLLCGILLIICSYISAFLYFFSIVQTYIVPLWVLVVMLLGMGATFAKQFSKAYDDLENASRELIKADKLKDEFLIHTSHEFKTPLHGIMNMAQSALERQGGSKRDQSETLAYIVSIASRLSSLVNDIMDVESMRNGQLRLNPVTFDINGTVHAVLHMLKDMRKGDGITLVNRISPGRFFVYADENRFRQIIVNLVGNGLKYTEKGSVEVQAQTDGNHVIITVSDTGIGMDENLKASLFQGATQAGEVNFTGTHSSGLGLAISRMLANSMNGELRLRYSEPRAGSCFELVLPCSAEAGSSQGGSRHTSLQDNAAIPDNLASASLLEGGTYKGRPPYEAYRDDDAAYASLPKTDADLAVSGQEASSWGGTAVKRHKILIVDDEPSNIRVLKEVFRNEPYELLVAYNGYQALEWIQASRDLSIVLLDVMMPGLSGYEVCQKIREQYEWFQLPVLLLTVRNTPEDIAAGLEAGANDFVVKPFDGKELRARVHTLQKMKEAVEQAIRMESVFLQSQIKPHFLYNALNIIISLCYSNPERAGELLEELSYYLRGSFNIDPHQSMVSLQKELTLVDSYLALEKARFEKRLAVEFDIAEEALDLQIPALIIQPLVENAIIHGLMKRLSGGTVAIKAELENGGLLLTVADNGLGIPPEKLESLLDHRQQTDSIGLKNVHKRLTNVYGQGLVIDSSPGEGTRITMRIPV
ncbi:hypothetical protein A7K91_01045 [Paenibacillus oryzae]|uniref:histidine kinase n=1 Tax=Paenibacillus oryzae TaxID=1844972 RepID=A0A1A5Y9I7_9BACL|nr:ATP-binding protein [Paenibacillus oryzae]OBR62247.1 hypothetical protein A7K91_01045 [Paenibacillus oryzae]